MFFRRARKRQLTFQDRLDAAKAAGFTVSAVDGGRVRASRGSFAALLEDSPAGPCFAERPGVLIDGEIGALVDGGFQKFFRTPSGKRKPALAAELKGIHEFEEDLRHALGMESLYNLSLGTVSSLYQYDRLQDRDRGVPKRPWE